MLEGLVIKINKVIVIVWVHKVAIAFGKNKAAAYMQFWQHGIVRVTNMEHLFSVIIKVFTLFIAQVGIGVAVADYFAWVFNTDGAMVGSDHNPHLFLGQEFQQIEQRRVLKPR